MVEYGLKLLSADVSFMAVENTNQYHNVFESMVGGITPEGYAQFMFFLMSADSDVSAIDVYGKFKQVDWLNKKRSGGSPYGEYIVLCSDTGRQIAVAMLEDPPCGMEADKVEKYLNLFFSNNNFLEDYEWILFGVATAAIAHMNSAVSRLEDKDTARIRSTSEIVGLTREILPYMDNVKDLDPGSKHAALQFLMGFGGIIE